MPMIERRAQERQLQFLDSVIQEINLGRSVEDVLKVAHAKLKGLVPFNRIAVAIYEPDKDRLALLECLSDGPTKLPVGYSGAVKGSSLEPILREGRLRVINDLEHYLEAKPASESTRLIVKEGMKSSLTLPLISNGRPVGAMFFSSRKRNAYTEEHEALLKRIVGPISIIVEKARLLDELRGTKERLEDILKNSADAIIIVDSDERIVSWNAGAERIFGYAEAEMVGRPFERLLPEESRTRGELKMIRDTILRRGYLTNYEAERLTKDGRRITINLTSTAMEDKAGRYVGRSAIIRDVTDLKHLQSEVTRSQSLAAVGEMAASIAHEVRNPLAGISGAMQVLRSGISEGDPRREVIEEVLDQVGRLDNTVRDLLMFSKPWTASKQESDLRDYVQRLCASAHAQERFARVHFLFEGEAELHVAFDPSLVEQVLWNVLINAADAMPAGGDIRCAFAKSPGAARVTIADTGGGIPAYVLGNLFRPFFTTKTRGTGLGLAICRKIMEAQGGSIGIMSEVGRGTAVTLEFPRTR